VRARTTHTDVSDAPTFITAGFFFTIVTDLTAPTSENTLRRALSVVEKLTSSGQQTNKRHPDNSKLQCLRTKEIIYEEAHTVLYE